VRPLPSRPVEVQIMGSSFLEVLTVEDISIGGVGVRVPHGFRLGDFDQSVQLIIALPAHRPFKAEAVIRHQLGAKDSSKFGVEFVRLGDPEAVRAYVERMLALGRRV
jgi:hypothetical protein